MIFFADRNLGRHTFPDRLRQAGIQIEVHDDHFEKDEADRLWIPRVASWEWIIITTDRRIRYNALEKQAVVNAKARVIALPGGNAKTEELAVNFVNSIAKVERFVNRHSPPFIAVLMRPAEREAKSGKPGIIRLRYP